MERFSDSQFKKSSTEDVEDHFEDSFGYNRENVSKSRSEAGLSLGVFTEVKVSSLLSCRAEVKVCNPAQRRMNFDVKKTLIF